MTIELDVVTTFQTKGFHNKMDYLGTLEAVVTTFQTKGFHNSKSN